MKIFYIYLIALLFSLTVYGQQTYIDTIPTRFWGVDENEYYTYISSNTGLYILERDSNNIFGNIYNIQDSLGLLFIHRNYLISGDDYRLKIFDIAEPTKPLLILDTLLNYPIHKFEVFKHYFVIRLKMGNSDYKFLLADIIGDKLL
ncbi:MAG: hypothetical protein IH852_10065, partial [Bacteroidetes bacterium]|nr:hypothetical protein [Bacteroidota bacterium]